MFNLSALVLVMISAFLPCIWWFFLTKLWVYNVSHVNSLALYLNTIVLSLTVAYCLILKEGHQSARLTTKHCLKLINGQACALICVVCLCLVYLSRGNLYAFTDPDWGVSILKQTSLVLIALLLMPILRTIVKAESFDIDVNQENNSGYFGTARFATHQDLKQISAYDSSRGPIIGKNDYDTIYLPMQNKLTLSPPGGGKTTCSSIPVLLSHEGPCFVFDIKGELWATTARYRQSTLKRKVVAIDPFKVTQSVDFQKDKPDDLSVFYQFNPFDYVPENQGERDRMINAFAQSFVINEGNNVNHFDENAKILIRGYIDYMMSLPKESRNLPTLFTLMSERMEEAMMTFDEMSKLTGRAGAAANQIGRVGQDERGSILSTSYRQIDWMGDSNLQDALSSSNFDLNDFIKGDLDIFIILPEDQIKEHNRLFRMVMTLLMSIIIKTPPSQLPQKKFLFLLEELAQLGACPDVEQSIEVLRARGVVVWTVFQSLKQIKLFAKPDLFLGVPLKQIFTTDDVETMQWIQSLGGKRTVLTKTLSNNKGENHQKMQWGGGNVSSGDGESIQETGVDLIQLNEIRELSFDEQFIFLHGQKPIRAKKVRYFEHPNFEGKFDKNPLEVR